jgi:hypothetical protein
MGAPLYDRGRKGTPSAMEGWDAKQRIRLHVRQFSHLSPDLKLCALPSPGVCLCRVIAKLTGVKITDGAHFFQLMHWQMAPNDPLMR